MVLRSSLHKASLPYWNFQPTPFFFLANSPHQVLPALLPTTNHWSSMHAILWLSLPGFGSEVVWPFTDFVICGELHETDFMAPSYRSIRVFLFRSECFEPRSCRIR